MSGHQTGVAKVRWAIEIQKTSLGSKNLPDLLRGLGFDLVEGIEYPALTSPAIDACVTARDAFEIAKRVRSAFKGPAQVDLDFVLGSVIDFSTTPPRRHAFLEVESCVATATGGTATITISPSSGLTPIELERWQADYEERQYHALLERQRARIEPAFINPSAAKVLELLSAENPSAEILYKVYELAEGHPDKRANFHRQFAITRDDFDRFRDAVHNPSVSGDWARHAYHGEPRTANPMTKGEAEAFVRGIASRWLNSLRASSVANQDS